MAASDGSDLDHLVEDSSKRDAASTKSGGVAAAAAAFQGGTPPRSTSPMERARASKPGSAASHTPGSPPPDEPRASPAKTSKAVSDVTPPSGFDASPQPGPSPPSSPEAPIKLSPPVREAKGFLLSARRAPSAAEEAALAAAANEATTEADDAPRPEPPAIKESATSLSGNARPNKRQGIGKNADGTPRKASLTPKGGSKASKAAKAEKAEKAADRSDPEQRDDRPLTGPLISRRPGASADLLPSAPEVVTPMEPPSIGSPMQPETIGQVVFRPRTPPQQHALPQQGTPSPQQQPARSPQSLSAAMMGSAAEEDEEDEDNLYGSVPATWQDSLSPQHVAGVNSNEVNVTVKSPKQSRLSRLTGARKQKKASRFVPKARLAYYGTIGGGFGTPRLGFAAGQFNTPTWMATQASGDLVVSSTFAHEVQVLSPRGGPAAVITSFHEEHLHDPQGIAIDGDHMYISDGGNGRVLKFTQTKQGVWMPALSSKPGLLDLPQGLALDDGLLFVVCGRMDRIHVLDAKKLTRLFSFGHDKPERKQNLSDPTCISVYYPPETGALQGVLGGRARKLLYVTDTEADRLAVFNMDGDFVAAIGSNGRDPGFFVEPLGIAIREEQVFVAEGGRGLGGRLQILKPDGTPLLVLPAPTGGRLVGVHWYDTRLYVSEIEAHRLHAFKIIA